MLDLKELKAFVNGFSVLHIEDNDALRENSLKLLSKFFDTVYTAPNGKEGLETFIKYHPQIVITDIKMPLMSGFELAQNIKKIAPETKIIIMSAFDDKEYLYQAIEVGAYRFLKKPVNLSDFTQILHDAVAIIKQEENLQLFDRAIKSIFNYQSSMVVMLQGSIPFLANQMFLTFFDVATIEEFIERYNNLGSQFLEHKGFLYNHDDKSWFEEVYANTQKLYHVKLQDKEGVMKHFLLKYQGVPQKANQSILSFDDITELNLLKLFDEQQSKNDENLQDRNALFKLLGVLQRNDAKVHLHNYYKGLSIANDAIITDIISDKIVVLKTNYLQQKAVQFEQKSLMVSDALPHDIACDTVIGISFDRQTIEFKNLHFLATSPVRRKTIRVVPEDVHTLSLFVEGKKFQGETKIEDLSLDAVKVELNALPAGLNEETEVILDIVLTMQKQHTIINTKAIMFRKYENKHSFSIIFLFKLQQQQKNSLLSYITNRQMSIIREFKGLQNG